MITFSSALYLMWACLFFGMFVQAIEDSEHPWRAAFVALVLSICWPLLTLYQLYRRVADQNDTP